MHRTILLWTTLALALGMAVTEHYALIYFWYWQFWWLDVLMHLTGGVVIGSLVYLVTGMRTFILGGVIAMGIVWEVFEYVSGISIVEHNFVADTAIDLCMDVLGGVGVYAMMGAWIQSPLRSSAGRAESPDQTSSSPSPQEPKSPES